MTSIRPARPLGLGARPFTLAAAMAVTLVITLLSGVGAAFAIPSAPDPVGVWPLRPEPEVVTVFDPPASPYAAGHRGVDLAGTPGQQVLAALPGTVTYAAPLAGRGVVVVAHGDTRTTYQPVSATVEVGEVVRSGDRLGVLDAGGSHCLPRACLHWGWIQGELYLDPLRLVGAGPVRLLPLWGELPSSAAATPHGSPTMTRTLVPSTTWRPLLQLLQAWGTG